jgi:capsule biosynthesis phosphatase
MKNITLIIPINGFGNKFDNEHYVMPKPLINVLGKPMLFWLLDNINVEHVSKILLPYDSVLDNFNFKYRLCDRYPNMEFIFRPIQYQTNSVVETLQLGLRELSSVDLDNRIVVMDSDTFYQEDILTAYSRQTHGDFLFYFDDLDNKDMFSYITMDYDRVTDIAEKIRISNYANCGVYGFANGHQLLSDCNDLLTDTVTNFYVSDIYQQMIKKNVYIKCRKVAKFHCVGTPEQLKIFCEKYAHTELKRFCFDLDHTLVSGPLTPGDYTSVEPITKNIEYLKHLHNQGHYIIIHTARRMKTHRGNVGAVIADIGSKTIKQLADFDIPYNELHFGKPHADFYIDDLAINCNTDIDKQVGFYNSVIEPRSFNHVELSSDTVVKIGNTAGELYYYKQITAFPHLSKYFPELVSDDGNKITLERIHGLNFSYLYTNHCLNSTQLTTLLDTLYLLHQTPCDTVNQSDIVNYNIEKIKTRFVSYDYSKFKDSNSLSKRMTGWLQNYYSSRQFVPSVIHGDPVFTNVLIDGYNNIKLIDMRGMVGPIFTIGGDPIYDLAKIYQSLVGYDSILSGVDRQPDQKLIKLFLDTVTDRYGVSVDTIEKMSATLFFTLIPLHNNNKCTDYYQLAKKLFC